MITLGRVFHLVPVTNPATAETDEVPPIAHMIPPGETAVAVTDLEGERLRGRMKRESVDLEHVTLQRASLIPGESSLSGERDVGSRLVRVKVGLSADTPVGIVFLPEMIVLVRVAVFQGGEALGDVVVIVERRDRRLSLGGEEEGRNGLFFLGDLLGEPMRKVIARRREQGGIRVDQGERRGGHDVDSGESELERVGTGEQRTSQRRPFRIGFG